MIPILTVVVLVRSLAGSRWFDLQKAGEGSEEPKKTKQPSSGNTLLRWAAIVGNIVLLGFIVWAFVDQYPHPEEAGFIPYVLVMAVTPILSVVVLWRD